MPRHVIFTLGETWPMGHKLVGPVALKESTPVYSSWDHKEISQFVEVVKEDDEYVTYADISFNKDTHFISCGIKTEITENNELIDCELLALFPAIKIIGE